MTKMNSKIDGNTLGILRRSFFPFNALGMPSFNNSVHFSHFGATYQLKTQSDGVNSSFYSHSTLITNVCAISRAKTKGSLYNDETKMLITANR